MPRKFPPLLFFLAFIGPLSGQDYRILHWGIEDGLSQGINQKIIRDSEGFLWTTSYEGVNRFDGKTFRSFYSFPEKRNSIKGTETTGLVEDSLHNIWIGSGNGVNRYDPVADSVITLSSKYIIPVATTSDEVICFEITGEITGYDCSTFKRRVIAANIPWHDDYVNVNNSWFDKERGLLWMPAAKGLVKIDLTTGKTDSFLTDEHVNAIIPAGDALLVGINHGYIEMSEGRMFYNYTLGGDPLGKVTCLASGKDNSTWVGTEEYGIFNISKDHRVTHIKKTNDPNSIRGNKINTIYCDTTGIVWISVSTNGIEQFIPGNRFTHYSENLDVKNNLSNNIVRCFIESPYKDLWIATQGGGINIFNPFTKQFSYLTKKNLPGLPFDLVRYMVKDEKVTAWIGTEKGMCRVNMLSLKTDRIVFSDKSPPDPYIEQIIPYQNNSWLIATKEFGLFQLNKDSLQAHQLPFPGNQHVFYTAFVNNLLFISVWDNDPKIFRVSGDNWTELKKDITRYTITYVLHDKPAKKYWIGTLKGLVETDENLSILHHYTRDDGLSNHYIYAMVMDDDGMLWISTNRGLSQFNTHTRAFRVFTPSDGLQGYEYNAKAGFRASDGSIYFGGTNGFDVIKPLATTASYEPARFYIKDLLINNVSYAGEKNKLSLPWSGNNITIQTGIIDFTSSGVNKIKYKLEGVDADWKIADRDFIINYSGLSPGNYSFVATAANMNNEWNSDYTTIHFTIAKPWWQSLWLRLGLIAIVVGGTVFVIRSYYRRQFEKQQAVEKERTRIATDMHDDLGAGLSRIKFLSETIGIKKQQEEPIEEDLGKIREYSHDMIDKMGEIVWALNEKNDSLNDLLSYTRAYAVEYLSQNGIKCSVNIPEHHPGSMFVSGEFRRNVYLAVKEALHNIVKHSQASHVNIDIRANHHLNISIKDDGIGFNENTIRPFSNGLNNMKKRMKAMGGTCDVLDGTGTTVVLNVPL